MTSGPTTPFGYRIVRLGPDGPDALRELLALSRGLYAVFRGEVGHWDDEAIVMTVGATTPEGEVSLVPTARPLDRTPPSDDGLYVHRWFHVDPADVEEFVELSAQAWPTFEDVFDGVRILGLWRQVRPETAEARLLLVTRYTDLAQWETSRFSAPRPAEGADDAFERFRRRRALTRRTIARFTRLVTSP